MRYVIFLLVAMNCAYFSWQVFLDGPVKPVERSLPPLSPDVRRLVTIQERDAQQSPSETRKIEDLTATQPPGAVLPLTCQALGPFLAESELKEFEKRLDRLGLTARHRPAISGNRSVTPSCYRLWIMRRRYRSSAGWKRRTSRPVLSAMDNMLSLGAFRDKSRAETILARAQALGLDPRIEPGYAKRSTYWLVIQGHENQDESLAGLTRKYSGLRVESMACP